ncbi:hypothetical protein GCM10010271_07670 [Streptomyces kurssanovii]|nr:hypothetical protein GCM10010271_07670 [Streptomyces kurssanovii]
MRDTLGTDMSMPCGAQAGRSIDVSNKSPRGSSAMSMASVRAEATDRPPRGRAQTEISGPFLVTPVRHAPLERDVVTCVRQTPPHMRRTRRHAEGRETGRRWPEAQRGDYLGAPTGLPSGETAYQVPPTPWPLVSPGLESPAKV